MTYDELKQDVIDYSEALEADIEILKTVFSDFIKSGARLEDAKSAVLKYEIKNNI